MPAKRIFSLAIIAFLGCSQGPIELHEASEENSWRSHPALREPDGESHRGDKMVAGDIEDPRVLAELGRRYRESQDFETRQEYLLRLLDHFYFSRNRLEGMRLEEIQSFFGPGEPEKPFPDHRRFVWGGGRDSLLIDFQGDLAIAATYIMGY